MSSSTERRTTLLTSLGGDIASPSSTHNSNDKESLLGKGHTKISPQDSNDELVGRLCRVRGHDEAVLCTGKPVFICFCIPWAFEFVLLRDGTTVRVIGLASEPGCWLIPDHSVKVSSGMGSGTDSRSTAVVKGGRRTPMTGLSALAAVSRAAAEVVVTSSSSTEEEVLSPEADVRDRISQILAKEPAPVPSHPPKEKDTTPGASATSFSLTTSGRAAATNAPNSSAKPRGDSKRPVHEERVQLVVHPTSAIGTSTASPARSTAKPGSVPPLLAPPVSDPRAIVIPVTDSSPTATTGRSGVAATATDVTLTIAPTTAISVLRASNAQFSTPSTSGSVVGQSGRLEEKRTHSLSSSPPASDTPLSPSTAIALAVENGTLTSSPSPSPTSATSPSSSSLPVASPSSAAAGEASPSSTGEMVGPVGANGASFATFRLPEGDITGSDIEQIATLMRSGARDITYPQIFGRLAGARRTLSGDVLRPFLHELLNKANVATTAATAARDSGAVGDVPREAMDVLWKLCAQIIDIRTGPDFLEINFNFGAGVKESTLNVPGAYAWVLDCKHKEDTLAVHPLNKPKYHCSDARTLVIRNQVRFKMGPNGIEGIRDGDIAVKVMLKFNIGLRTVHKPNMIEYDSLNRPYIEVKDGKPVIADGHYVPRRFNDWLVINVLKKDIFIGLPDIATA